jgi:hypothetical protein
MVESFWRRMQVELLNRQTWKTRIELATVIHEYIETFHNTRRRHSSLQILGPTEYEHRHQHAHNAAGLQELDSTEAGSDHFLHGTRGVSNSIWSSARFAP